MRVKLIESFRVRYYEDEMYYCKLLNIESLELDELSLRNYKLNKSNFKSELWFIEHLKCLDLNLVCHRNYPVLNRYFADFYFPDLNVVIEIDGKSHENSKDYDNRRDKLFFNRGLNVIRIKYLDEVKANETVSKLHGLYLMKFLSKKRILKNVKRPVKSKKLNKKAHKKINDTYRKSYKNHNVADYLKIRDQLWNKMMMDALKK